MISYQFFTSTEVWLRLLFNLSEQDFKNNFLKIIGSVCLQCARFAEKTRFLSNN